MTHYIYISGFGDRFDTLRRMALKRWTAPDAQVTLVSMCWSDKQETYEQKYARVLEALQQARADKIVLVGESAGGAMALLVFARHHEQIDSVVTLCGYNQGADDVLQYHHTRKPAFYPLMQEVDETMRAVSPALLGRIITVYSTRDHIVTVRHSQIEGARQVALAVPGHLLCIGYVLFKGPRSWL